MKDYKMHQKEAKRLTQIEKYEKKELNILLSKSNINTSFSKFSENFNLKIDNIKNRIDHKSEVLLNNI